MVFCGIYPINTNDYIKLTAALEKFQLQRFFYYLRKRKFRRARLGYRLGFMGMLHMEITLERLKREYGQELIATMPSVIYKVVMTDGTFQMIDNPSKFPDPTHIDHIEEPIITLRVFVPTAFVGRLWPCPMKNAPNSSPWNTRIKSVPC